MADTTRGIVRRPLIIGSILLFVVLFAGLLPRSALLSRQVAHASSPEVQHLKPHLLGLRLTGNAATAPAFSQSRYITPKDLASPTRLNTDGCDQAHAAVGGSNPGAIVILDFGGNVFKQGSGYGTYLPGSNATKPVFASNSVIYTLVKKYITGFIHCNVNNAFLNLGVGTNNDVFKTVADASADGQEWGTLLSNVNSWINTQGISSWVEAYGASDIELAYSTAALARAWTDGFLANYSFYFDYGDAKDCPKADSTSDGRCANGWHQSDVAYVAWNANGALPMPEIYSTAGGNAKQWQSIVYYQRNNLGASFPMVIEGAVTEYKACQQVGGCNGIDNTPAAGWTQLYKALNANSATAQDLPYSSDFQWDN